MQGFLPLGAGLPFDADALPPFWPPEQPAGAQAGWGLGTGEASTSQGQQQSKGSSEGAPKQRLRWTPELHQRFCSACNQLGGPETATPKRILVAMAVPGLSLCHVKSHLQKYRLAISGGAGGKGGGGDGGRKRKGRPASGAESGAGGGSDAENGGEEEEGPSQGPAAAQTPLPQPAGQQGSGQPAGQPSGQQGSGQNLGDAAAAGRQLAVGPQPAEQQLQRQGSGQGLGDAGAAGQGIAVGPQPAGQQGQRHDGGEACKGEQSDAAQGLGLWEASQGQSLQPLHAPHSGSSSQRGARHPALLPSGTDLGPPVAAGEQAAAAAAAAVGAAGQGEPSAAALSEREGNRLRMERALQMQRELQQQLQAALEAQRELQCRLLAHGRFIERLIRGGSGEEINSPEGAAARAAAAGQGNRKLSRSGSGPSKDKKPHSSQPSSGGGGGVGNGGGGAKAPGLAVAGRREGERPAHGDAAVPPPPPPQQQQQQQQRPAPHQQDRPGPQLQQLPGPPPLPQQQQRWPALQQQPPGPQQRQQQQQLPWLAAAAPHPTTTVPTLPTWGEEVLLAAGGTAQRGASAAFHVDPAAVLGRLAQGLPVHQVELAALLGPTSPLTPSQKEHTVYAAGQQQRSLQGAQHSAFSSEAGEAAAACMLSTALNSSIPAPTPLEPPRWAALQQLQLGPAPESPLPPSSAAQLCGVANCQLPLGWLRGLHPSGPAAHAHAQALPGSGQSTPRGQSSSRQTSATAFTARSPSLASRPHLHDGGSPGHGSSFFGPALEAGGSSLLLVQPQQHDASQVQQQSQQAQQQQQSQQAQQHGEVEGVGQDQPPSATGLAMLDFMLEDPDMFLLDDSTL